MKKKGSFLEQSVANLFRKADFETSVNNQENDFEIDVLAEKGNFKIVIECKQYENSYINIGSLLHEWKSKGEVCNADRTIVVIAGVEIPDKFYRVAEKLGIYLIGEDTIHYLLSLDRNELKDEINDLIKFDEDGYEDSLKIERKRSMVRIFLKVLTGLVILIVVYLLFIL